MFYCPYCGAELVDGAVFCANCGQKIQINSDAAGTESAQPKPEYVFSRPVAQKNHLLTAILAAGFLSVSGSVFSFLMSFERGGMAFAYVTIAILPIALGLCIASWVLAKKTKTQIKAITEPLSGQNKAANIISKITLPFAIISTVAVGIVSIVLPIVILAEKM